MTRHATFPPVRICHQSHTNLMMARTKLTPKFVPSPRTSSDMMNFGQIPKAEETKNQRWNSKSEDAETLRNLFRSCEFDLDPQKLTPAMILDTYGEFAKYNPVSFRREVGYARSLVQNECKYIFAANMLINADH